MDNEEELNDIYCNDNRRDSMIDIIGSDDIATTFSSAQIVNESSSIIGLLNVVTMLFAESREHVLCLKYLRIKYLSNPLNYNKEYMGSLGKLYSSLNCSMPHISLISSNKELIESIRISTFKYFMEMHNKRELETTTMKLASLVLGNDFALNYIGDACDSEIILYFIHLLR